MYKTKDLYLATTLKTLGYILVDIARESDDINFLSFVFEDPDQTAYHTEQEWFNRQLRVEPKLFEDNIRDLRRRVFEARKTTGLD